MEYIDGRGRKESHWEGVEIEVEGGVDVVG